MHDITSLAWSITVITLYIPSVSGNVYGGSLCGPGTVQVQFVISNLCKMIVLILPVCKEELGEVTCALDHYGTAVS